MKVNFKKSFFKIFIGGMIFIAASGALASAPLCASVFSETRIIHAVEDLAQMRMTLDLAQSAGLSSAALKTLAAKYPEKYKELLQLTHSEELLKRLIHEKIQQLQDLKKENLEQKTAKRAQEGTEIVDTRKFKMRIPLTFAPPASKDTIMEYVPSAQSVIAQTKSGNTVIIDLKTSSLTYPLGINTFHTRAQLSASGDEIVILSPTQISTYNLIEKKMISQQPLQGPALRINAKQNLTWNSLRTKIAFIDRVQGLAILDIATGRSKIVYAQEEIHMTSAFFINDHKLMITQDIGPSLTYDINTRQVREFTSTTVKTFTNFQLASDGSPVGIAIHNRSIHILDKNNLRRTTDVFGFHMAKFYQNNGALIMDKSLPDADIFDFKNPEKGWIRIEEFSKFYSEEAPGEIETITITGGNLLVRAREDNGEFIDIWSIK